MADKKITDLPEIPEVSDDDYLEIVDVSAGTSNKVKVSDLRNKGVVFLTTPLTSTAWDGDSYSTIGKTKIDLNTVFGTPPNTKAVLVWYGVRDSGSETFDANLELSPNAVLPDGMSVGCSGLGNDKWMRGMVVVPCDEDGNVYYRITASGANTMDIYLQIWGYWL